MNDFTREELEEITGALSYFINRNPDADTELFEKIESMIDNYCEHSEKTYSRKTGKLVCPICHTYFGDNGDETESRLQGYLNDNQ